jgi:hypothetical protein
MPLWGKRKKKVDGSPSKAEEKSEAATSSVTHHSCWLLANVFSIMHLWKTLIQILCLLLMIKQI